MRREESSQNGTDLVSEGQTGEGRQTLRPAYGHEEQSRRALVDRLLPAREQQWLVRRHACAQSLRRRADADVTASCAVHVHDVNRFVLAA